jgi:hypothetical protein
LRAATERARREKKTTGEVISALARCALNTPPATPAARQPKALFGLRPFPKRGRIVTKELIDKLREEDAYRCAIF